MLVGVHVHVVGRLVLVGCPIIEIILAFLLRLSELRVVVDLSVMRKVIQPT